MFPFSLRGGKFSCIASSFGNDFERALLSLNTGDEVAIKAGRRLLSPVGAMCDNPIRRITLICSSAMAIAPSLQVLQTLDDGNISLEKINFIWINDNSDEFICNDAVLELYKAHKDKLEVHRFVTSSLDDFATFEADEFLSAVDRYEPGSVALLCGPPAANQVMKLLLSRYSYTAENLLSIEL